MLFRSWQKQKDLELQQYIEKIDAEIYSARGKLRGSQSFKAILKDTLIKKRAKEFYLPKNKQYVNLEKEEQKFKFNATKFKNENPALYEAYLEEKPSQLKISFRDATDTEQAEASMDDMFENAEKYAGIVLKQEVEVGKK